MLSAATIQACDRYLEKPHVVFKIKDGIGVVWQVRHGGKVFFQSLDESEARDFFDRLISLGLRAAYGEIFQTAGGI
jgi:hypothetical protein